MPKLQDAKELTAPLEELVRELKSELNDGRVTLTSWFGSPTTWVRRRTRSPRRSAPSMKP
jgi:hypothetical protein